MATRRTTTTPKAPEPTVDEPTPTLNERVDRIERHLAAVSPAFAAELTEGDDQ